MVVSYTPQFEVVWKDPADGQLYWGIDRIHFQRPFPELGKAVLETIMTIAFGRRTVFVNDYAYMHNYGPPEPPPEVQGCDPFDLWHREYKPRVQQGCEAMRRPDYDAMSLKGLASAVPSWLRSAAETFRYTTIVILAFTEPVMDLLEFCEAELGPAGPTFVAALLQGIDNETAQAGIGMSELTRLALELPAVAAALRERRYDDLASVEGGERFLQRLDEFLEVYGWRAEDWSLLQVPTWREEPRRCLEHVASYLEDPQRLPLAALSRSAQDRENATQAIEARLQPEKLPEFRRLLQRSLGHVPMSEERAFWQLTILGSLRVPLVALGRKLTERGVIETANDVFYLSVDEIQQAAAGQLGPMTLEVASRKERLARNATLQPPNYLGQPLNPDDLSPLMKRFVRHFRGSGGGREEGSTIKGLGGAKGTARGVARLIRDLGEANRLQPGEILVCQTTSPPWTPLFAIAAGVVTDTGGILSHSAICAREYAIPAVVGARVATQRIPDGATISIDGSTGLVVIESVP